MASSTDQFFISQFSADIHVLLEQKTSKLRPLVKVDQARGEKHFFNRFGQATASEVPGVGAPTNRSDGEHSRRMATVRRYHSGIELDDIDALKMLNDPTSIYTQQIAIAHGRNFDDVIFQALLGDAKGGKDGDTTVNFDTTNQQIVHGSTGMSVSKFHTGIQKLLEAEVDLDMDNVVCVMDPESYTELLNDNTNQFISADYRNGGQLDQKYINSFRGIPIILSNRIPAEDATTKRAIMFSDRAIRVAMTHDLILKQGEDHTRNWIKVFDTYMMFGAVRMEEALVVDILLDRTA